MRKENSSEKESVVLSNGERTSPVSHFEFAAYSKGYEKNLWEKKRKEVLTSDLSPGAILYLACIMGSYLSPKNKITSALEVNDDTKPYLFGNFIEKENPDFKERTLYSHNYLSAIFSPKSKNSSLISRTINTEAVKQKYELIEKEALANEEKIIISSSLKEVSEDYIESLIETLERNYLIFKGDYEQLSKMEKDKIVKKIEKKESTDLTSPSRKRRI